MEWNGRHAQVDDNGELETSILPTHVEVGVYVKAFANLYGDGWIQVPVKLTEYEGQKLHRHWHPQKSVELLHQVPRGHDIEH